MCVSRLFRHLHVYVCVGALVFFFFVGGEELRVLVSMCACSVWLH